MATLSLYKVSDDVLAALENGFDEETGEATPELEEARAQQASTAWSFYFNHHGRKPH